MSGAGLSSLSVRRYGAAPGSHAHDHFQVLWGWQGALELEIEGRGVRVDAGCAAVIAPGARHDFWAPASSVCLVLDTDAPALAPLAGRALAASPALRGWLGTLAADARGPLPANAAAVLLASLHARAGAGRARRAIDWAALGAWADARLAEPLAVADLAACACLSPTQFAARCRAETGLAPMAWLRARRLAAAGAARAQGRPVACTAQACGYRSPSALTAALRRAREDEAGGG